MKKKQTSVKSLQQYGWTQTSINRIIHYISTKELPRGFNLRQRNGFAEKFGKGSWLIFHQISYEATSCYTRTRVAAIW